MLAVVLLLLGLVLVVAGAEGLIRGACGIALSLGLSPLVTGLTVVAFGTSAPELAVSISSGLKGSGGMMIGNVVGSNIFNVAVILAITALITPLKVQLQVIRLDVPVMLFATLVFVLFAVPGSGISRWEGAVLFLGGLVYTVILIRLARREKKFPAVRSIEAAPAVPGPKGWLAWQVSLAVGGLGLLVFGATLMVDNAIILATRLGVSNAVIGLTIVAAGTSLPELATSVVAALRRQADIAIGNIVGSNIFNLLMIGGVASLVAPAALGDIRGLDFGLMALTSVLLLPFLRTGFRMVRWEGALLWASYLGYLYIRWPRG